MTILIHESLFETPCGLMVLQGTGRELVTCDWAGGLHRQRHAARLSKELGPIQIVPGTDAAIDAARRQLDEYFSGRRRQFDIALHPAGTPFQKAVWQALQAIGWGLLATYGQVAAAIGRPRAVRAVGLAVGANPISIIVPCHRVVGSDGSITGFGGGLAAKRKLLELEGFDVGDGGLELTRLSKVAARN